MDVDSQAWRKSFLFWRKYPPPLIALAPGPVTSTSHTHIPTTRTSQHLFSKDEQKHTKNSQQAEENKRANRPEGPEWGVPRGMFRPIRGRGGSSRRPPGERLSGVRVLLIPPDLLSLEEKGRPPRPQVRYGGRPSYLVSLLFSPA